MFLLHWIMHRTRCQQFSERLFLHNYLEFMITFWKVCFRFFYQWPHDGSQILPLRALVASSIYSFLRVSCNWPSFVAAVWTKQHNGRFNSTRMHFVIPHALPDSRVAFYPEPQVNELRDSQRKGSLTVCGQWGKLDQGWDWGDKVTHVRDGCFWIQIRMDRITSIGKSCPIKAWQAAIMPVFVWAGLDSWSPHSEGDKLYFKHTITLIWHYAGVAKLVPGSRPLFVWKQIESLARRLIDWLRSLLSV